MESQSGKFYYAVYSNFSVSDEYSDYKLLFNNKTSGNTGDGLRYNKNRGFTARNRDRDSWHSGNCARHYRSGFWLDRCGSDLNRDPSMGSYGGTRWDGRIVKSSLMKIKPAYAITEDDLRLVPRKENRYG